MREGYINISRHRTWFAVYGYEKTGTPLLVLHGGPGFLTMTEVVRDLSVDRPVYFYDQFGCGKSERSVDKSDYSLETYLDELDSVIKELKLSNLYLMGFSWGAALACAYMIKKEHTGVSGLILCGPLLSTTLWYNDQRNLISQMPDSVRLAIETGEATADYGKDYQAAMMEYYYRHVCRLQPWPEFLNKAFSNLNTDVYEKMWGPSEFTISGTLRSLDLTPDLQMIKVPVILTCGDNDEVSVETLKDYQEAFPDARLTVIPDASHLHHIEQPDIFKVIVNQFLQST